MNFGNSQQNSYSRASADRASYTATRSQDETVPFAQLVFEQVSFTGDDEDYVYSTGKPYSRLSAEYYQLDSSTISSSTLTSSINNMYNGAIQNHQHNEISGGGKGGSSPTRFARQQQQQQQHGYGVNSSISGVTSSMSMVPSNPSNSSSSNSITGGIVGGSGTRPRNCTFDESSKPMPKIRPTIRTLSQPDIPTPRGASANGERVHSAMRWKACCGCTALLNLLLLFLIAMYIVYFLLFRSPYVYIDQVQVTHIPNAAKGDRRLGFAVLIALDNLSVRNITVTSAYLQVALIDTLSSPHIEYAIGSPIETVTSLDLDKFKTSKIQVSSILSISDNTYLMQIERLFSSNPPTYAISLTGNITVKTTTLSRTIKVSKVQQLYNLSSSKSPFNSSRTYTGHDDDDATHDTLQRVLLSTEVVSSEVSHKPMR